MAAERTLVLIKPDAVRRGLAGEILRRFELRGLEIREARLLTVDRELAGEHYAEHAEKPFFARARRVHHFGADPGARAGGGGGDRDRPHDDGRDEPGRRRPRNDPRRSCALDARQPRARLGLGGVGGA